MADKDLLATKWGQFDSLESFQREALQDGRFSISIDGGNFECLYFGVKNPERLFVLLSGARDPKTQTLPKFNRWSWHKDFPGAVLCISDPTLYLDEEELRIGWYLGDSQRDWMTAMGSLVREILGRLNLVTRQVVT